MEDLGMRFIGVTAYGANVKFSNTNVVRYFSFSKLGRDEAIAQAKAFRDEYYYSTSYWLRPDNRGRKSSDGSGRGVVLERMRLEIRAPSGRRITPQAFFTVTFNKDDGSISYKRFGIKTLGYEQAYRQALRFRFADYPNLDPDAVPLFHPSPVAYVKIRDMAEDVPYPVPDAHLQLLHYLDSLQSAQDQNLHSSE